MLISLSRARSIFGSGITGGGGGIVPRPEHIFASPTARDTYFTSNLVDLTTGLPIFVTDSGTTYLEIWGGVDQPASYDNTSWVRGGTTITAAQVKALYESNADTNAFTDAFQTLLQALDGVTTGTLPVKTASGYGDSALSQTASEIVSTLPVRVPSGSLFIGGSLNLKSGNVALYVASEALGITSYVLTQNFTSAGSQDAFLQYNDTAETDIDIETVDTATSSGDVTFSWTAPNVLNRGNLVRAVELEPATSATDVVVTVRAISAAGGELVISAPTTVTANTALEIPFTSDLLTTPGGVYHFTITGSATFKGSTASGSFVPRATLKQRGVLFDPVLSAGNFNRLVMSGDPSTDDQIIVINQDGTRRYEPLPTGGGGGISGVNIQDEGSALTTAATTLNFVGAGVEATGTGATKTITIDGGISGITVEDEGTALTTAATRLNFVGAGVVVTGAGTEKTITIAGTTPTPGSGPNDLRYGLSTQSDAALVDFGALTDVAAPTDPQTVSTGTTSAGQYFYIFSSNSHDIQTITDTVLSQIVYQDGATGNIFTKTDDARTESGITYDSYRIGPLNAGVDEEYILRFT